MNSHANNSTSILFRRFSEVLQKMFCTFFYKTLIFWVISRKRCKFSCRRTKFDFQPAVSQHLPHLHNKKNTKPFTFFISSIFILKVFFVGRPFFQYFEKNSWKTLFFLEEKWTFSIENTSKSIDLSKYVYSKVFSYNLFLCQYLQLFLTFYLPPPRYGGYLPLDESIHRDVISLVSWAISTYHTNFRPIDLLAKSAQPKSLRHCTNYAPLMYLLFLRYRFPFFFRKMKHF